MQRRRKRPLLPRSFRPVPFYLRPGRCNLQSLPGRRAIVASYIKCHRIGQKLMDFLTTAIDSLSFQYGNLPDFIKNPVSFDFFHPAGDFMDVFFAFFVSILLHIVNDKPNTIIATNIIAKPQNTKL